jgi:type IV pilus assembly protein PilM
MGLDALRKITSAPTLQKLLSASSAKKPGTSGVLPIAVDFGVGSLKVLQVEAGEPLKLVAAARLETPDDLLNKHAERLEFQVKALPKLIKHGGFKGKRVVCAIPSWQTSCKQIQFQRTEGLPVATLVDAAIPVQFGRDPSSLVYRYLELGGAGGKLDVIVFAVGRDLVDKLMRALTGSKLEPVGMHSEFHAAVRAFDHIHRREGDLDTTTLYLDIGTATTNVMIAHGTSLAFARVVDVGGARLDELLAKQLDCSISEARRRRQEMESAAALPAGASGPRAAAVEGERRAQQTPAGFGGEVLSQPAVPVSPESGDLREPLEMLTDEVQMCLRYHASQHPQRKVDRVLFLGGQSRYRGLCQHVARQLRLSAQVVDPIARVARGGTEPTLGVDFRQAQPGWAVTLGLCLSPTDL